MDKLNIDDDNDILNIDTEIKDYKEDEILNIDKEMKNNENNKNSKKSPIIIKKLPINIIKENINNNISNMEDTPTSCPSRTKNENLRRIKSLKLGEYSDINKNRRTSLFNEESKSDDEENINDKKFDIIIEEETEGRKSIYTKYNDNLYEGIYESSNMNDFYDDTKYIKKLEEIWKYEKILLDYNIIDFTSKYK